MHARRRAGTSALARFRQERRRAIGRNWKDWASLAIVIPALAVGLLFADGLGQLLLAWAMGVACMAALVGWIIGGDVASLPWLWGAVGEQTTGELLQALPPDWHVEHDVVYRYGNWDHILIGPGGVFLLDTKNLRGKTVTVKDDALCSGRMRFPGASFRGAAVGLKEALEAEVGPSLFVKAVAVVWGDFPQRHLELQRVTYIAGDQLLAWLEGLPTRLTPARKDALVDGIRVLATSAETPAPQPELAQTASRT